MIQTGLRVPENQYDRIREKAKKTVARIERSEEQ